MKSRRFMLTMGLGFTAVSLLGCAPTAQQPSSAPQPATAPAQTKTGQTPTQASEPAVLRSGSFVSGEHSTAGTVRIVNRAGQRVLELDSAFKTSSGPDLVVILHRSANVIGSSQPPAFPIQPNDWLLLAPLKQSSGAQSYEIPNTANLDEFQSAAIWCRQFNATFGAATLNA